MSRISVYNVPMQETLLSTKVVAPPLRPTLVARSHLIERLNLGLDNGCKLTLISAPAGFGKTTLIAEWGLRMAAATATHSAVRVPRFCWLSLDEGDNDPSRFLSYLVAAIRQAAGTESAIGKGALAMLQAPQPPPTTAVLTALINDITAVPESLLLTLDDYHVIDSTEVDGAIAFLIEHLPSNLHLAIATRDDPQLPLARLRAGGQLTELRALDLRFTSVEAAEFLNQVMGLNLAAEDIAALETRTEGWIAGLQLAAISMQGQKDAAAHVKSFTGSHRFVLDYLIEEVVAQQPDLVQNFLLQTAVLDQMNGPLCDALTAQNNGQATLEMLDHANLFIIPLDEERRWYRYHHLFGDLLRQQLQQKQPDSMPMLQIRASDWYEQNGFVDEAVAYALRAGDFERAAYLVEEEAEAVWQQGEYTKLRRWVAKLPLELVHAKPRLCIIHAESLILSGHQYEAEQALEAAEESLNNGTDGTGKNVQQKHGWMSNRERMTLLGRVAATRSFLAFYRGDVPGIMAHSRQALELLPEQDSAWRSSAANAIGDAHIIQGDMDAAEQVELEALEASKAAGNVFMTLITGAKLAVTLRNRGRLAQAIDICRQQLQLANENGLSQSAIAGWLLAIWGEILAEFNDLDEAAQKTKKGAELAGRGGPGEDVAMLGWSNLCLVRVLFSREDVTGAERIIQKIESFTHGADVPPWITSMTAAWQARLWLAQDDLESASNWANEYGLNNGGQPLPVQEAGFFSMFDYVVLARLLLALGQLDEAGELLSQLTRPAEAGDQTARAIEILILQALTFQAQGARNKAIDMLEQALILAEPGGFVRIFVDEGAPMELLLQEAAVRRIAPDYVRTLLASFSTTAPPEAGFSRAHAAAVKAQAALPDPLSERELEVLQLISDGLTNQEIASRLFLSLHTVKVHTRNIYGKLDVHTRTQAVARARMIGILPSI